MLLVSFPTTRSRAPPSPANPRKGGELRRQSCCWTLIGEFPPFHSHSHSHSARKNFCLLSEPSLPYRVVVPWGGERRKARQNRKQSAGKRTIHSLRLALQRGKTRTRVGSLITTHLLSPPSELGLASCRFWLLPGRSVCRRYSPRPRPLLLLLLLPAAEFLPDLSNHFGAGWLLPGARPPRSAGLLHPSSAAAGVSRTAEREELAKR